MSKKDYYEVLDVARDVNEAELKKAYKRMASKHHPDKGGDEEKFKQAKEAYDVFIECSKTRGI